MRVAFAADVLSAVGAARRASFGRRESRVRLASVMQEVERSGGPTADFLRGRAVTFDGVPAANDERREPPERPVYVCNDAVSPMKDVARFLEDTFTVHANEALFLMLAAHEFGYATLGPYPNDAVQGIVETANTEAERRGLSLEISEHRPDTTEWARTDSGLLPRGGERE
jgi:ATP-dependent Clp protease adapter protein ClpS